MWNYYSYPNLLTKDPNFNCLSHLACIYRGYGVSQRSLYYSANITYCLIPVAEIRTGVYIRGDRLSPDSSDRTINSRGNSQPGFKSGTSGVVFGRYRIEIYFPSYGKEVILNKLTATPVRKSIGAHREIPSSNPKNPYTYIEKAYYKDDNNPSYNTEINPLTYDSDTKEFTFDITLDAAEIKTYLQSYIETDYPNNSCNIDSSFSYHDIVSCKLGAVRQEYGPITAPLFTIPFIRS